MGSWSWELVGSKRWLKASVRKVKSSGRTAKEFGSSNWYKMMLRSWRDLKGDR